MARSLLICLLAFLCLIVLSRVFERWLWQLEHSGESLVPVAALEHACH
jgi:hypothetical protein